jgi:hypothetical protein
MRNSLSAVGSAAVSKPWNLGATPRRSIAELLAPVERIAAHSPNIIANRNARFEVDGEPYVLPGYLFIGPKSGDAPIRIGIFAAIHGDEEEGALAAVRFLQYLDNYADLAAGYCLGVYPVCNPTGFEDNTRHSRRGKDLNREFWSRSGEPEVKLLQSELVSRSFHGIISLHVDDGRAGFHGVVGQPTLARHVLEPALKAAGAFLPLDHRAPAGGLAAGNPFARESFPRALSAPPSIRPRSFEIILKAPKVRPSFLTECAFVAALQSILSGYREFIAHALNL